MARTVVAIFESYYSADRAVRELFKDGFPRDMVDVFPTTHIKSSENASETKIDSLQPEIEVDGASIGLKVGAGVGGAVGGTSGLLALMGALNLSLLTPLVAGSPLAAALAFFLFTGVGAASGGLTGSLFGHFLGMGISDAEARQYAKNVRENDVAVTVLADWDSVDPVIEILSRYNPLEVQEKALGRLKTGRVEVRTRHSHFTGAHEHRNKR